MSKRIDLTGRVFGRLVVLRFAGKDRHGFAKWLCVCSCGNTTQIISISLVSGNNNHKECKK